MRRSSESQRAQQMPEHRLSIFGGDPEHAEHFVLQRRLMNSNAASADFDPIENNVVSFGADLRKFRLVVEQRDVFSFRSGERMMHCIPFVFFRAPKQQWKIVDP